MKVIVCPQCGKFNSPDGSNCMVCGATLPMTIPTGMDFEKSTLEIKTVEGVKIENKFVICPDGSKISLADIKEVTAPRILIGVDPSLPEGAVQTGQSNGGIVVIKHLPEFLRKKNRRPLDKVIRVGSFAQADEIVNKINSARHKQSWRERAEDNIESALPVTTAPAITKSDAVPIISLALGLLSFTTICVVPPVGLLTSIVGLVLGIVGIKASGNKRTIPIVGIVISSLGLITNGVMSVILFRAIISAQ